MITKTPRRHRCDGSCPRDPRNAVPGGGTGHAAPGVAVWTNSAPGGVDVSVQTDRGDQGLSGLVHHTSTVQATRSVNRCRHSSSVLSRPKVRISRGSGSRAIRLARTGTSP